MHTVVKKPRKGSCRADEGEEITTGRRRDGDGSDAQRELQFQPSICRDDGPSHLCAGRVTVQWLRIVLPSSPPPASRKRGPDADTRRGSVPDGRKKEEAVCAEDSGRSEEVPPQSRVASDRATNGRACYSRLSETGEVAITPLCAKRRGNNLAGDG